MLLPPKPRRGPACAPLVPPRLALPKALKEKTKERHVQVHGHGRVLASSAPAEISVLGFGTPTTGGGHSPRSELGDSDEEYPAEYGLSGLESSDPTEGADLQFEFVEVETIDADMGELQEPADDFVAWTYDCTGSWAPSSFQDRIGSYPGDHGYGASPLLSACLAAVAPRP
mmetsp:Transcript_15673/g.34570  ORF Transcript_15673/g.34570 Transcript_15673/m.34570 type:complete len:171 (+) Transcript_15673:94-606(+)